ncbi:uncharacterized protein LOC142803025 [Rhipicephalus microplus]|uniref:uncharacterized protein LOC142803025 n=1 Tax=Rhipicephalus microplus TaxID=6941 RepID=UPI003F6D2F48
MASSLPKTSRGRRPSVLQWNINWLGRQRDDLAEHLLQSDYDVLALQEVYAGVEDLRLPGYVGYSSRTGCTLATCHDAPCLNDGHQQGRFWCAVYAKRELPQAEVKVADLVGGPFGSCAVRIYIRGQDTTVASIYVREFLLYGDVNAKHPAWGGRRTDARGREVRDILQQLGLAIVNSDADTFLRRGHQATSTPIDLSVTTEGCQYAWSPFPDTWGLDHLPILLSPFRGRAPRDREYCVVDWQVYRRLLKQDTSSRDLLQLVAYNATAATVTAKVQQGQPVPDIRHLALRAARGRAEWQALNIAQLELWTVFQQIDAVCRRHARRRRNQGWQGVCVSINRSRDGTKAWRLLKWVSAQVRELCEEPIDELVAALERTKQRSAPGADGITFQMPTKVACAISNCLNDTEHKCALESGYEASDGSSDSEKALTDDEIQELLFGDESDLDVDSDSGDEAEKFQPESALHSDESDEIEDSSSEDENVKNKKFEKTL